MYSYEKKLIRFGVIEPYGDVYFYIFVNLGCVYLIPLSFWDFNFQGYLKQ